MSAIDQPAGMRIVTVLAPMMKTPPRSRRKKLGWLLVLTLLAGGALAWPLVRQVRLVRQSIPPRPDLAATRAVFADEVAAAEADARAWGFSRAGLARLAGLYHANGFFAEALSCYRALAVLEPREARWPHLIANIEAGFGRLDAALPQQRRAAELAPGDFMVHLRLGDLLFKTNAATAAEQAYARALEIEPANPYARLGLGRCALQRNDWSGARLHLRQAVAARADFVAAWALLATVEDRLGDAAAAAEARRRGNGQFREIADPWLGFLTDLCYDPYQLSVLAATTPEPARARALLERAIALAPEVAATRRQLARLLIDARETSAARQQLEKAVSLAPDDAEAWGALITLLMDIKDARAASAALQEGLRHCPQSGFLHFTNGRRLAALGRTAEAETELKISQRLQPAEIRGYVELSSLYVQSGRVADAMREATAALAVDPRNPLVLGMLAQLAIMQEDEAAARAWTAKIRDLPSDESATLRQIATMFQQQFSRPLAE